MGWGEEKVSADYQIQYELDKRKEKVHVMLWEEEERESGYSMKMCDKKEKKKENLIN